jgi:hypothetical protein
MAVVKNLDAITALYTVLKAALAPTPVFDSFVLTDQSMPLVVKVANDDDPDSKTTGQYDQQFTSLDMTDRQESPAFIFCVIVAQSGGADMAGLRVTVRDTATSIDAALRANPTLSGVVDRAWFGLSGETKAEANPGGINARLVFTVNYEAAV